MSRRDRDAFDAICDHLLVIDHDTPRREVGRGRRSSALTACCARTSPPAIPASTSSNEFDVGRCCRPSLGGLKFLELGRSCVLPPYRTKRTVELLWHGIWSYVRGHGMDVMVGCASLEGTDPDQLALPLSFLHHNCRARRANGASPPCPAAASPWTACRRRRST